MSHSPHTFHIPVMGTGFSIDSPIKVAKYGIDSVISLVDDTLIEEMRKFYARKEGLDYTPITKYEDDYRARRITAYLDLVDHLVNKDFAMIQAAPFAPGSEITKYFEMLPEDSDLMARYRAMLQETDSSARQRRQDELRAAMRPGKINVNIMTKLDRPNFSNKDGSPLPPEFSDALAALRGFAESRLRSAVIFSAGLNQRLYSYAANFKDFYADAGGQIKKTIILKVSDYRSSLIQGKIFAKKGLWVSEYRVESGLNCGGHAFATQGFLMGPILEEFREKKQELIDQLHKIYNSALEVKSRICFPEPHVTRFTAQGGIGTAAEDKTLREYYQLDGTGWGTPFLLCPEATNVDEPTLKKLAAAREQDLYLSDVSPLGVPFNNLRDSEADAERDRRADAGRPGSACPKGHLVSNTEFTEKPICSASRQYQKLKLEALAGEGLSEPEYRARAQKVMVKSCLCNDLGEGALIRHQVPKNGKRFSAVCPGPNLAYFSKIVSLREMVDHIYGRGNIMTAAQRPHMFIKELVLYVDYLIKDVKKQAPDITGKQAEYFGKFRDSLLDGMAYYREHLPRILRDSGGQLTAVLDEMSSIHERLEEFVERYVWCFVEPETPVLTAS